MSPEIQVVVFSVLLSVAICYAWWVRFRVWMLRQDIFNIRDELWESMRLSGELDDPSHREMREALNALIRLAPLLSVLTILRVLTDETYAAVLTTKDVGIAVRTARNRTVIRVTRYLFLETFSGLLAVVIVGAVVFFIRRPARFVKEFLERMVARALESTEMRELGVSLVDPKLLSDF